MSDIELNNKIQSPVESEKPLDPDRGKEIYDEIIENQKSWEELAKKAHELTKDIPDSSIGAVSEAVESLRSGGITEDEFLDKFSDAKTKELATQFKLVREQTDRIEALQEQHKPYRMEEINNLSNNLASRFDWNTFLKYYDFDPYNPSERKDKGYMSNTLSEFSVVREVQQQYIDGTLSQQSYDRLDFYKEELQSLAKGWEKRGFLSDSIQTHGEALSIEETKQKRLLLKGRLEQVKSFAEDYASLKTKFRSLPNPHKFRDGAFEEVLKSLDIENSHGREPLKQYDYDPRYLDAVHQFAADRIRQYCKSDVLPMLDEKEYKAYINKLRNIDTETALSGITIEGFEERSGEILVVDEESFRDKLRTLVPACFLENIELVVVTDKPKDLNKDNPNIETTGNYTSEFDDKGNLVKSHIEIYRSPRVPESADVRLKALAKLNFYSTALHEIAHSIHHKLTYDDMKNWEEVIKKDPTEVTWYVGHMQEKHDSLRLKEDFCETYQIAVLDPPALYSLSPERYLYMMKFMGKYMGDAQRKVFFDYVDSTIAKYTQSKEEFAELIAEEEGEQTTNG